MGVYPSPDGHWLAVVGQSSQPSLARYQFTHPLYLVPATGGTPRLVDEGLDRDGTGRHGPGLVTRLAASGLCPRRTALAGPGKRWGAAPTTARC